MDAHQGSASDVAAHLSLLQCAECEIPIFKENWTSEDLCGRAADIWRSRGREFKSYDMRFPQSVELGHSIRVSGDDRSATGSAVWECESLSIREAVVGNQTMRQAARLAASQAYAKRRRERAQRDRRLEKLAIEVLTALGERDATIAATEQRAGAALQAMITDESLTVSEAVQWCAGAISHREATRLRHLTAGTQQPG
jgi:hypothetical protein